MNLDRPFVSIIIPARNEEAYIAACLDSVLANDYPKEKMEIFVVDGMSRDSTRAVVVEYAQKYPFVKLLANEKETTPYAMNMGIKAARGALIMKMDAHTMYEKDYISKCVQYGKEYDADNVGGVLVSRPGADTFVARAIAAGLMQKFGSGNSYFRVGSKVPREVDTVAFGCYKRKMFDKLGLYNEKLARSQDMELNLRLRKAGGRIVLAPDIVGYYYASTRLGLFFRHNVLDGIWTTYPLAFGIKVFSVRHLVPLAFTGALVVLGAGATFAPILLFGFLALVVAYLLVSFAASIGVAFEQKEIRYLYFMPVVFATRHLGYGIGSVIGLWRALARKFGVSYNG